jgi:hypothetical protein
MTVITGYKLKDGSGVQLETPLEVVTVADITAFEQQMNFKHGKRKSPTTAIFNLKNNVKHTPDIYPP